MAKKIMVIMTTITLLVLGCVPFQAETKKHYIFATDTTYAPFEFQDEKGDYVGIDMDLVESIAQNQGFTYEMRSLGFNAAVQALESGQVDAVIAGMTITEERKKKIDFSDPYFDSGIIMGISNDNNTIKTYEDLQGKTVVAKVGTASYDFAMASKDKYGFNLKTFDDTDSMYKDVVNGNSDALFEDYPVLAYGVSKGNGLKIVTEKESQGSYGVAVQKGKNQELVSMFNNGLAELRENGEYQMILDRYLNVSASKEDTSFLGLIKGNYKSILNGLITTVLLTFVSLIFAIILGIIFGLLSVSGNKFANIIAEIYVDIMRGTPLLVLAFFIYMGIPSLLNIKLDANIAGVITLSINAGAYIAEIVRAGINAVDHGQMEAARSLGMPYGTTMQKVILPQAIKIMIPSFVNQFVITLKDTSILSVIGIVELTQTGKLVIARNFESFKMWLIIGIVYIVIITILTKISKQLERRIKHA